jgi:hypothetical protein
LFLAPRASRTVEWGLPREIQRQVDGGKLIWSGGLIENPEIPVLIFKQAGCRRSGQSVRLIEAPLERSAYEGTDRPQTVELNPPDPDRVVAIREQRKDAGLREDSPSVTMNGTNFAPSKRSSPDSVPIQV